MLESATSRQMRLRQEWQLGCSRNWLSEEALRMEGVEPSPSAPKTETLPLRYTPIGYYFNPSSQGYMEWLEGFEPSLETWQASVRTINTVTTFGGEQGIFTLSTSLTK